MVKKTTQSIAREYIGRITEVVNECVVEVRKLQKNKNSLVSPTAVAFLIRRHLINQAARFVVVKKEK